MGSRFSTANQYPVIVANAENGCAVFVAVASYFEFIAAAALKVWSLISWAFCKE
jgi:hypothetical protein